MIKTGLFRFTRFCMVQMLAAFLATGAAAQAPDVDPEQPGRFDGGKMWTFEYAPADYFTETYGFQADRAWFERARMAALRIPGCSASFVSPNGLLATNHHCVRSRAVSRVSQPEENLLDNGFYAATLEDERPIPDYYAEQLIAIEDVTQEIDAARDDGREEAIERIQERLLAAHRTEGDSIWVQVVPLYNGGRHSAYVFMRFTDVRLVMAVELQAGFFGGDPDNFTYPRYALDFAFLRVYGDDGEPYRPSHYFGWGDEGVEEGDVVFVIGSPGSTSRHTTMAQLDYLRDYRVPTQRNWLSSRHAALDRFLDSDRETAERFNVRNLMFSLSNSLKAAVGRLEALNTDVIMARRSNAEAALRDSIAAREELEERYGDLFDRMASIQDRRRELTREMGAFFLIGHPTYGSRLMRRALFATELLSSDEPAEETRTALVEVEDYPYGMELEILTERLADFVRYYGADHPLGQAALTDGSERATAAALLGNSILASQESTRNALLEGSLPSDDPAIRFVSEMMDAYEHYTETNEELSTTERGLAADLGRVKFEVYGRSVPPDGTRSPRITDGVVRGYEYNGTLAPPYTTFYGIYDRHHAHAGAIDWALPERWETPPEGLDLSTPLNFVSTADTYGGNSGSPAVTRDLELVGLNFDRNINGLSRDYIYLPEQGRNIMVDTRAVQASLDVAYDADRIVQELLTGSLYRTEAEADRQ